MVDDQHPFSTDRSASDRTLTVATIFDDYHGGDLSADGAIAQLVAWLKTVPEQTAAYGLDDQNHEQCQLWVTHQFELYQDYWPLFCQLCQGRLHIVSPPSAVLWTLWLPLVTRLINQHHMAQRPFVQGILGGQGTGKTTLATVVGDVLRHLGYRVCSLSIDDLYKTHDERQAMREADPRLLWRGPPGTHDVALGVKVLSELKQKTTDSLIEIPRFDKSLHDGSGDRVAPEPIDGADIILFEGWFVGARPLSNSIFESAPFPITTDADRQFARDINHRLADYVPLWDLMDQLLVMYPMDYRLSQQWRQEAEEKMQAEGKAGMSRDEIQQFVHYFWRSLHPELFITPMIKQADYVDWVVLINGDRSIRSISIPTSPSRSK